MNEDIYKEIFNTFKDGIVIYKPLGGSDFLVENMNDAAVTMMRMKDKKGIIGKEAKEAFPGIKEMGLLKFFSKVNKEGGALSCPSALYRDGSITQWFNNYVVKLSSGEIVAFFNDETERKKADIENNKHSQELKEMNDLMMGRELKMVELKREIKQLKETVK